MIKHKNKILVLAGDGIGPEVTAATTPIFNFLNQKLGYQFELEEGLIGHAAILDQGDPLPKKTLQQFEMADAILLGAVGDPSYDNDPSLTVRPEQGLLRMRAHLGLYTNLRPIKVFHALADASSLKPELLEGVDILFYRELTGGIYFGKPSMRQAGGTKAIDTMCYSKMEVRRIVVKAFEAARQRKKVLHSVDKANVLETSRLWREVVQEVQTTYPDVAVIHMFVDNAAMQLLRDPRQFDVVVTGNMFGDILTDEAAQLAGSLGMLASASIGARVGVYEPIHGAAPDIAGQGIANPLATILSVALMLEHSFGLSQESEAIVSAVEQFLEQGYRTADTAVGSTAPEFILGTSATGKKILALLDQIFTKATQEQCVQFEFDKKS